MASRTRDSPLWAPTGCKRTQEVGQAVRVRERLCRVWSSRCTPGGSCTDIIINPILLTTRELRSSSRVCKEQSWNVRYDPNHDVYATAAQVHAYTPVVLSPHISRTYTFKMYSTYQETSPGIYLGHIYGPMYLDSRHEDCRHQLSLQHSLLWEVRYIDLRVFFW